ncbi:MAG: hypothetical protein QW332_06095 [Thermoproteota archaeon]
MPLYRTGLDMYKKYVAKYNPTVISTRFTDVQEVAQERAQAGLNKVATVRDLVRPILDQYGVTGGMRGTYQAFALALWKHIERQKGDVATAIANGLSDYYVTAYGCNADILNEIIQVVAGWVIQY